MMTAKATRILQKFWANIASPFFRASVWHAKKNLPQPKDRFAHFVRRGGQLLTTRTAPAHQQ